MTLGADGESRRHCGLRMGWLGPVLAVIVKCLYEFLLD